MTILSYFILDPHALDAVQGEHHVHLVLISWAIALAASYTGLEIIKLVSKAKYAGWRGLWLLTGAGIMGLGVWSMHFTGMHAYRLDFAINHDPGMTVLSMLPAIAGSLGTMLVLSRREPSHLASLLAGVGLGLGIGLMHYTGMAAMRMPALLYHDMTLFLVSLFVAMGLGILSVYAYRLCRQEWGLKRARLCAFLSALCVSLAICSMHYVAMQAAWFVPLVNETVQPAALHESHWLIYLVSGSTVMIALLTLAATRAQRRLHASVQHEHMTRTRLLEVIAALQDGVILYDESRRIRLCNAAFERLMGWSAGEVIGRSVRELGYADDSSTLSDSILLSLQERGEWRGTFEARRRDGTYFPVWLSVSRVTYTDSDERDYVALLSDRSAEQQAQQRIRYLAYHDTLTSLPNRRSLQERLQGRDRLQSEETLSLLVLFDIDRFKVLNDSLGQGIGDELLRQLAARLRRWAGGDLHVSRLDSNEFALLARLSTLHGPSAEREAYQLTERVLAALTADYSLDGHTYPCRLCVGMLLFDPQRKTSHAQLFKQASLALLEAKRKRDFEPQLFHPEQEREREARFIIERELRSAIDNGELCLHLQPQVDAEQRVFGAEALVRWQHPLRGAVSPGQFIPLAEESGLILPLGAWVLNEGCRLLGEWRQDPERCELKLSLNVSVRQFLQPDFVEQVLLAIERHSVVPERLTLELTESLLLNDPEVCIEKMQELRRMGIGFALDDFGTGYSSMAYLKLLPLDTLKIDIAFVRDLDHDPQSTPIATAIIALAKSLNLAVIAEGVETETQRAVLAELGCDQYQGFLFGRPLPAESFQPKLDMSVA